MHPAGTHARLAHDDLESPAQMHADCVQAETNLHLDRAARVAVEPAPSIHFENYPREVRKREIDISEAAARLAAAIYTD